jgi:hypothetical protein
VSAGSLRESEGRQAQDHGLGHAVPLPFTEPDGIIASVNNAKMSEMLGGEVGKSRRRLRGGEEITGRHRSQDA